MAAALLSLPPSDTALSPSDQLEILCACASANPVPEQIARMERLNYPNFDWTGFLRFAEHHGVLPLVAHNLTRCTRLLPSEIKSSLQSSYAGNLRKNLWFAGELTRIVEHLAKHHVRAIPYKGPVLAQWAYGDLGLRSFSDLDLLISPADFAPARTALEELGFHPSQQLSPAVERLVLRTGYERSFDGAGTKNLVELQWDLVPSFYAVDSGAADFRLANLFARARRVSLGSGAVPCLSPEDSLLVLCLHAAKHLWTRLIWIADIAASMRLPGIDFGGVLDRARAMGIVRILGISCWLAQELFGTSLPPAAREVLAEDPKVRRIGEECTARLAQAASYDFESARYFRQIWELRERPKDRLRYIWRLAFTPGPGEIATVELPEVLFPLYRLVRVGRLLGKI